jgi:phosphatidylglycerophosphatase C
VTHTDAGEDAPDVRGPEPARPAEPTASRPVVAAFDFDGTLSDRGSAFPFLIAVRGLLPVLGATLATSPQLVRAAIQGGRAADDAKERLFTRLLGGVDVGRIDRVAAAFARRYLQRHLRREVVDRLDWHRAQGHRVLIVSASPECYLRFVGEALGADGVVATRLAVGGGDLLTGRYEGKNCRGNEKAARMLSWLRAHNHAGNGAARPEIWAYGNSRGDLRLLAAADHGVNVGRLGAFGRLRHYPPLKSVLATSPRT